MYPFIIMGDGLAKATLRIFGVTIERSWTKTDTESGSTSGNTERGELRRAMGEILTSGSLPKERKKEVLRALDIDYIPVRKKMTDREEIVAVSTEYPLTENLQLMTDERRFSRYPLMGNTLEDFQGTLYIADVFAHIHNLQEGKCQLRDLATPPLTFDSEMPVSQAIDEFQKHRQELALIEEDGQVIGLITITQSLEAIAGEIEDPFDSASR